MVRYNGKYVYLCEKKQQTCGYNEFKSRLQRNYVDYQVLCQQNGK